MRQIAVDGAACSYRQTGGEGWFGSGLARSRLGCFNLAVACRFSAPHQRPAPKQVSVHHPPPPTDAWGKEGQGARGWRCLSVSSIVGLTF